MAAAACAVPVPLRAAPAFVPRAGGTRASGAGFFSGFGFFAVLLPTFAFARRTTTRRLGVAFAVLARPRARAGAGRPTAPRAVPRAGLERALRARDSLRARSSEGDRDGMAILLSGQARARVRQGARLRIERTGPQPRRQRAKRERRGTLRIRGDDGLLPA